MENAREVTIAYFTTLFWHQCGEKEKVMKNPQDNCCHSQDLKQAHLNCCQQCYNLNQPAGIKSCFQTLAFLFTDFLYKILTYKQ
jgi:hypothetical protein